LNEESLNDLDEMERDVCSTYLLVASSGISRRYNPHSFDHQSRWRNECSGLLRPVGGAKCEATPTDAIDKYVTFCILLLAGFSTPVSFGRAPATESSLRALHWLCEQGQSS